MPPAPRHTSMACATHSHTVTLLENLRASNIQGGGSTPPSLERLVPNQVGKNGPPQTSRNIRQVHHTAQSTSPIQLIDQYSEAANAGLYNLTWIKVLRYPLLGYCYCTTPHSVIPDLQLGVPCLGRWIDTTSTFLVHKPKIWNALTLTHYSG